MRFNSLILLLLLFIYPINGVAQHVLKAPKGGLRDTEPKDFLAKNMESDFYNELYTYQIQLDNGVQIIYTFSINDFGSFKDRVSGAKLSVTWIDGKTYVINKEYPIQDFVNKAEGNVIRLHPERTYWAEGSFEKEHVLNFDTYKDGIEWDLNLTLYDIAQGKILGDGVYNVGDQELGITLLIPHAKVKGYVSINGEKVEATGIAVMDLKYQNSKSTDFVKKNYTIKSGDTENGFFLNFLIVNNNGYSLPVGYGVYYANGLQRMITPSSIKSLEVKETHGADLDTKLLIKPYQTDTLHFQVKEHFDSYSILDELKGLKKIIARKFVGGEVIEINGTAAINDTLPAFFNFKVVD